MARKEETGMDITEQRAKIIMALLGMENCKSGAAQLASALGFAKSSVFDALLWCSRNGYASRTGNGLFELTRKGIAYSTAVSRRVKENEALPEKSGAKERSRDASFRAVMEYVEKKYVFSFTSASLADALAERVRAGQGVEWRNITPKLPDGRYTCMLFCYQAIRKKTGVLLPSMANEGFESLCELTVTDGHGLMRVKSIPLSHPSAYDGVMKEGILATLKYKDGDRFLAAAKERSIFSFPVDSMVIFQAGDGSFQGSIGLKASCTAGGMHMPESQLIMLCYFQ
jgi:hypothetical protein